MIPDRVIEKLKALPQGSPEECWEWPMSKGSHGYGQIGWWEDGKGFGTTAHRVSWLAFRGEIPDGMTIDHICSWRPCWNPNHLRLYTLQENGRDGSPNTRKTHCVYGHEFTIENTLITKNGWRHCRECNKRNCKGYQARRKARSF